MKKSPIEHSPVKANSNQDRFSCRKAFKFDCIAEWTALSCLKATMWLESQLFGDVWRLLRHLVALLQLNGLDSQSVPGLVAFLQQS